MGFFQALLCALPAAAAVVATGPMPARRICRPGPLDVTPKGQQKRVLVIGDSISIGQMGKLRQMLKDVAVVVHAPTEMGGGAVDTKYAMDVDVSMTGAGTGPPWLGNLSKEERYGDGCLNGTMLVTSKQEPVPYDVISFNYGVHDVYYGPGMKKSAEALVEEWTNPDLYASNIRAIKKTLQATGAKVVFQASTPICYNVTTNERIKSYNAAAKHIMAEEPAADFNDAYKVITDACGQPPYNTFNYPNTPNCSIANYNNVHYQEGGWELLAKSTAAAIRKLLVEADETAIAPSTQHREAPVQCGDSSKMFCPAGSTCMVSGWSATKMGCCLGYGPNAVHCPHNFHCCPEGWTCSSSCALGQCSCLPPAIV